MFDFNSLPLSPDHARAARNYFGFTQAKAADESGLPAHKIKRFESGNYIPDIDFLNDYRAFFEQRGYKFDDTPAPGAKAKEKGQVFPAGVVDADGDESAVQPNARPVRASFHHMRIALNDPEMGHVLDLIEQNEEKVQDLLRQPVQKGVLDQFSDQCEAKHGESMKLLAENGILFAKLFGREVGGSPAADVLAGKQAPKTHAELLHRVHADAYMVAAGDAAAKERRKAKKPAGTLLAAIFG
ncbi:MAG: XRE family transcriptional regulator [Rubrivivax sp.]|nr:MAG: XRE family transcriptional regulator [Rubrivivax sp.]